MFDFIFGKENNSIFISHGFTADYLQLHSPQRPSPPQRLLIITPA